MRIQVLSDSHGNKRNFCSAVAQQPKAEVVIFLGDGFRDLDYVCEKYSQKAFISVKGNCDIGSNFNSSETITLYEKRIYITHGYTEQVKGGISLLESMARSKNCQIALFGHTHETYKAYRDGIYFLNPGSIHLSRNEGNPTYGIIDITPQGIVTNTVILK